MNAYDFTNEAPGNLVQIQGDLPAYVPAPLPPQIVLANRTSKLVSEVTNHLGRLDGTARRLPDPTVLIRSFVRREAQLSSYIENTYADYDEMARSDETDDEQSLPKPLRETRNAERAITAGLDAVRKRSHPVNNTLIRSMHELLLKDVRGHETRGKYRDKQVFIGKEGLGLEHARFIPPPFHEVPHLMDDFQRYLTAEDDLPIPVKLGLIHYQFETIHPFEDGNGRLGRALIALGLCETGLLTVPVFNPSVHFERYRDAYYDGLLEVSTRGRWERWIDFFLEGLRTAAIESGQKLDEIIELQRQYHERVRSARSSALLLHLIDRLLVTPVITVGHVQRWNDVTYAAARSHIDKLMEANILRSIPGSRPKQFIASEIILALNPIPTRR